MSTRADRSTNILLAMPAGLSVHNLSPDWNSWVMIGWIAMKYGRDIHGSQKV